MGEAYRRQTSPTSCLRLDAARSAHRVRTTIDIHTVTIHAGRPVIPGLAIIVGVGVLVGRGKSDGIVSRSCMVLRGVEALLHGSTAIAIEMSRWLAIQGQTAAVPVGVRRAVGGEIGSVHGVLVLLRHVVRLGRQARDSLPRQEERYVPLPLQCQRGRCMQGAGRWTSWKLRTQNACSGRPSFLMKLVLVQLGKNYSQASSCCLYT